MSSLASIPGGEVLDTSSRRSSSNSKKTNSKKNSKAQSSSETKGATNSKAESSTDSQKTRATARSELMEEAKRIGKALEALRPEFNDTADLFPINTWNDNKAVFATWRFLIADVDNCTEWLAKSRNDMNLRLQNPPGQDCMFQVVPRTIFLTQFHSNGFFERTLREIHKASQAAAE